MPIDQFEKLLQRINPNLYIAHTSRYLAQVRLKGGQYASCELPNGAIIRYFEDKMLIAVRERVVPYTRIPSEWRKGLRHRSFFDTLVALHKMGVI